MSEPPEHDGATDFTAHEPPPQQPPSDVDDPGVPGGPARSGPPPEHGGPIGQTSRSAIGSGDRPPGQSKRRSKGSMVPDAEPRSYYGQPIIKPAVWTWEIPWYFWIGGMSGACATVATTAKLAGNGPLARRASFVALTGSLVSPVLLISDLGYPKRFLNMLRVFKVTSPMSVGSWILSTYGATTAPAALWQLTGVPPKRIGLPFGIASALLGPPLSTYTATLIANTAVPVWHDARHELPFVFAGSSLASAGGVLTWMTPPEHAAPARALGVGGALLEVAAVMRMERRLDPRVRASYEDAGVRPLKEGAKWLTLAGAAGIVAGQVLRGRASRRTRAVERVARTAEQAIRLGRGARAGARIAPSPLDVVKAAPAFLPGPQGSKPRAAWTLAPSLHQVGRALSDARPAPDRRLSRLRRSQGLLAPALLSRGGGLLIVAGSACERWAVIKAGRISAKDPEQTVGPQRDRVKESGRRPQQPARGEQPTVDPGAPQAPRPGTGPGHPTAPGPGTPDLPDAFEIAPRRGV